MLIQVGLSIEGLPRNNLTCTTYQNTSQELVNGSMGVVIGFQSARDAVLERQRIVGIDWDDKRFRGRYGQDVLADVAKKLGMVSPNQPSQGMQETRNFTLDQQWPLVKFTNGQDLLCGPVSFTVTGIKGNLEASRSQVPLILSWAISIHKAQGQTMSRLKIDMNRIFEKGQSG